MRVRAKTNCVLCRVPNNLKPKSVIRGLVQCVLEKMLCFFMGVLGWRKGGVLLAVRKGWGVKEEPPQASSLLAAVS